jgi:hypothetical protein
MSGLADRWLALADVNQSVVPLGSRRVLYENFDQHLPRSGIAE